MPRNAMQRQEGGRRLREQSRSKPPLISIITVVFQARNELEDILNNICIFDRTQFEWIVIDGDSQDGTSEFLEASNDKIDYWLSEPDSGIYDAMNKAKSAAQGDFLLHLNAGDRLLYLPCRELAASLQEDMDIAAFPVLVDGRRKFQPSAGFQLRIKNTLHHQGTFYRRKKFLTYDLQYKILADFDLNQRLIRNGATVKVFDDAITLHSTDGLSNRAALADSEHFRIIRNNYGQPWVLLSRLQRKWAGLMARIGRG